jgi:hypothetical protein
MLKQSETQRFGAARVQPREGHGLKRMEGISKRGIAPEVELLFDVPR